MDYFAGLDVSVKETSFCIVDDARTPRITTTGATTEMYEHRSHWRDAQFNDTGSGGSNGNRAVRRRTGIDRCVLAGRQLLVGWPDLSPRQPAAQATTLKGTHQAAAPRPLGNDARLKLHLCSPEPGDQEARPRHDLYHRPRAWRSRPGRECLPRGNLQ